MLTWPRVMMFHSEFSGVTNGGQPPREILKEENGLLFNVSICYSVKCSQCARSHALDSQDAIITLKIL